MLTRIGAGSRFCIGCQARRANVVAKPRGSEGCGGFEKQKKRNDRRSIQAEIGVDVFNAR
jgi:hypothetical protein